MDGTQMNANELADYLDNNVEAMIMSEQQYIDQAAATLRQQQAEIESLKKYFEAWMFLNNGMIELASNARKIIKKAETNERL